MSMRKIVWSGLGLFLLLIVAAVAIPSFLEPRITANEPIAIGAMRQIRNAETKFQEENQGKILDLSELCKLKLIDAAIIDNIYYGYKFSIEREGNSFVLDVIPVTYQRRTTRSFHMDKGGIIHVADKQGRKATDADCVIGLDCGK